MYVVLQQQQWQQQEKSKWKQTKAQSQWGNHMRERITRKLAKQESLEARTEHAVKEFKVERERDPFLGLTFCGQANVSRTCYTCCYLHTHRHTRTAHQLLPLEKLFVKHLEAQLLWLLWPARHHYANCNLAWIWVKITISVADNSTNWSSWKPQTKNKMMPFAIVVAVALEKWLRVSTS